MLFSVLGACSGSDDNAQTEIDPAAGEFWETLISSDGSMLTARHEAASVVIDEHIYLIGGRGNRPVERYSTVTGQWENLGLAPMELHHMQPVVVGQSIYVIGAFTCCFPLEDLVAQIHVFDTSTGVWDTAGTVPAERLRGSAAAVTYNNKIYLLGGNTLGHSGGAVAWFDEYDPATGDWRELADAPNARDHFSAVMIDDQLVAAAGRQTNLPRPAANPVLTTDIYDFTLGQWRSTTNIPTVRAGTVAVGYDGEVIVAGGEISTSDDALNVVEAFDVDSDTWRTLPGMNTGRHGSGGGIVGRQFHVLSGASTIGGASETIDAEVFLLQAESQ